MLDHLSRKVFEEKDIVAGCWDSHEGIGFVDFAVRSDTRIHVIPKQVGEAGANPIPHTLIASLLSDLTELLLEGDGVCEQYEVGSFITIGDLPFRGNEHSYFVFICEAERFKRESQALGIVVGIDSEYPGHGALGHGSAEEVDEIVSLGLGQIHASCGNSS